MSERRPSRQMTVPGVLDASVRKAGQVGWPASFARYLSLCILVRPGDWPNTQSAASASAEARQMLRLGGSGSKCEELNVSKSGPLCSVERT
jgi:hypothetical protein